MHRSLVIMQKRNVVGDAPGANDHISGFADSNPFAAKKAIILGSQQSQSGTAQILAIQFYEICFGCLEVLPETKPLENFQQEEISHKNLGKVYSGAYPGYHPARDGGSAWAGLDVDGLQGYALGQASGLYYTVPIVATTLLVLTGMEAWRTELAIAALAVAGGAWMSGTGKLGT